jgi:hypothetical protein
MNRITKEPFYARAAYIGARGQMVKSTGRFLQPLQPCIPDLHHYA